MSAEHTPLTDIDMAYFSSILVEATEPYETLNQAAFGLGLPVYSSLFQKDAKDRAKSVGQAYLDGVRKGPVGDTSLAYELALAQDEFEIARAQIARSAIKSSIETRLMGTLDGDIIEKQEIVFKEYVKLGKAILSNQEIISIKSASSLEELSIEDIEKLYNVDPIGKNDLTKLGGGSSIVSRAWGAVEANVDRQLWAPSSGQEDQSHGPTIRAAADWPTGSSDNSSTDLQVDFFSLYDAVRWTDERVNEGNLNVSEILGYNNGARTLDILRGVVQSRKLKT